LAAETMKALLSEAFPDEDVYRIVESLRLEKISKIIKPNRQSITTMSAKPCPEVPYQHVR